MIQRLLQTIFLVYCVTRAKLSLEVCAKADCDSTCSLQNEPGGLWTLNLPNLGYFLTPLYSEQCSLHQWLRARKNWGIYTHVYEFLLKSKQALHSWHSSEGRVFLLQVTSLLCLKGGEPVSPSLPQSPSHRTQTLLRQGWQVRVYLRKVSNIYENNCFNQPERKQKISLSILVI